MTAENSKRAAPGKPFQPGQSGNPGGRPAFAKEVRELAQKHSAAAVERLAELLNSPDERVQVAAANAILDRAVGKPTQGIEHSGPEGAPLTGLDLSRLTDEELAQFRAFALKAKTKGDNE